jgi:peptidyl-prolyl cis-trans isomerase SurA
MRFSKLFSSSSPALLVLLTAFALNGCGSSKELTVAEIKKGETVQTTITLPEFERRYTENNKTVDVAKTEGVAKYKEFLERYIDFRLKVKDAENEKLDQKPEVREELTQYRNQMAPAYLQEREVMEKALKELFERRQDEVNASHILIRTARESSPAETLAAYQKIMGILTDLKAKRINFDSAAYNYSEDPSAKGNPQFPPNYGNLKYFTAGMMVSEFEDAAFTAAKGSIVGPIRTQFGYHVLDIRDRRQRKEIQASHIMAFCQPTAAPADTMTAYKKLADALAELQSGKDFAEVAKGVSDDRQTGERGGDLGGFGRGQIPSQEFEDAAFAIKKVGDLSPIIRSKFGYHLIKLTRIGGKTFDEEKENLKTLIRRNTDKLNAEEDRLIGRLKKEYGFTENSPAYRVLMVKSDSLVPLASVTEKLTAAQKSATIFTIASRTYTLDSLLNYLKENNVPSANDDAIERSTESYIKREVKNYAVSQLEKKYPEFERLMSDYRDGIMLFAVSEKRVWSQAAPNDSIGKAYFAANKSRYNYNERVAVSEIAVMTEDQATKLYEELTAGKRTVDAVTREMVTKQQKDAKAFLTKSRRSKTFKAIKDSVEKSLASLKVDDKARTFSDLAMKYSARESDSLKTGYLGFFQKGESKVADAVFDKQIGFINPPVNQDGVFVIARLDKRDAPRPKLYEEARAEVFSQYQEETTKRLEKEWIDALRKANQISINDENLSKAFQLTSSEPKTDTTKVADNSQK